jgi:ketosteroid isomerase-like protein
MTSRSTIARNRRLSSFLCCVLMLLAVSTSDAQPKPVLSDQEILIQLERDWHAAFLRKDVAFIAGLLADDFVATYGDGARGDKKRELELVAAFDQQVDSSAQDEFIVKVHRDTAVVWFTQRMVGPVKGKPTEVAYRYIDVWVMRDGRWQCIASQSTRLAS